MATNNRPGGMCRRSPNRTTQAARARQCRGHPVSSARVALAEHWAQGEPGGRGRRTERGDFFLLPQLAASCDKTADFRTNLLHTAQIFNHAISKKCRSNISKTHELKLIKNTAIHRRYFKRLTYPPLIVTRTLESGHSKFGALTLQHLNVSKQVNILLNLFSHFLILESSR